MVRRVGGTVPFGSGASERAGPSRTVDDVDISQQFARRRGHGKAVAVIAALVVPLALSACTSTPAPIPTSASVSAPATAQTSFSLSVADGTFTLAGAAADDEARARAAAAVAEGLGANVQFVNNLGVAPGAGLPSPDGLVSLASAMVKVEAVSLNVNGSDAVVGGTVTSEQEKQAAGDAVTAAFPGAALRNDVAVVALCDVKGAKVRELAKPPALSFATGSTELSEAALASVARIAEVIAACPGTQVTVVGQTDARGAEPGNEDLARRRAQAVGDALAAAGVPAGDVVVQGNAANAPVSGDSVLNRRVDVAVR